MDRGALLTQLERGDLVEIAPRLGGMARADGVVIVSERFWAFARVDGSLKEGMMPRAPRVLRAIPVARGLARLAGSLSPLFRRTGVARGRERLFLAVAILAPLALVFAPSWVGLTAGLVTTGALLAWLLRGRTLFLHGAEHRAIAALEERRLRETWHGSARPSRFSLRCGTNFAALLMPVAVFGGHFWPLPATALTPLVISLLALGLTMELWLIVQGSLRLARVVLLPGLGLQRLTTREPRLDETRVALTALAAVLRRELAHAHG
ncbi:hypothetical protein BH18ACT12_BH18ACT12_05340 [soil metagenome]